VRVWEWIRSSRRNTLAAVVGAVLVVVGVLWLANVGPFAPSAEEVISDKLGTSARCRSYGLADVAGEQEKVYRCTYHTPDGIESRCFSVVDGDAYDVTSRMSGC
jgi:hypothetical protein